MAYLGRVRVSRGSRVVRSRRGKDLCLNMCKLYTAFW